MRVVVSGAIGYGVRPDVWFVNAATLKGDTRARVLTLQQYQSRQAHTLILVERITTLAQVRPTLDALQVQAREYLPLPMSVRKPLLLNVLGGVPPKTTASNWDVHSTGIIATCAALSSGASMVCLSGFSATPTGHFYDADAPRDHIAADCDGWQRLSQRYGARLETTEPALHEQFGFRLR